MIPRHHQQHHTQGGDDVEHPVLYHSSTFVRLSRLQLNRRYLILRVDRMTMEGMDCIFLTLRQCPRSHIYTAIPLDPFGPPTVRDLNIGMLVATVA